MVALAVIINLRLEAGLVQVLIGSLFIFLIFGFFVFIGILSAAIKIVKQYEKGVIFRLGRVIGEKEPGLRFIIPVIDRLVKVSLRTVTMPIPSQKIITKDNVSIDVAAVSYFHVVDATKSIVAIENVFGFRLKSHAFERTLYPSKLAHIVAKGTVALPKQTENGH